MKDKIHPKYASCTVKCACGETFETGSVRENMRWTFAPSVTRSIQGVRSSSIQVAASINSDGDGSEVDLKWRKPHFSGRTSPFWI